MDEVLTLPASVRIDGEVRAASPRPSAAEMRRAVIHTASEAARHAASADPVEAAVALLLSRGADHAAAAADRLATSTEAGDAGADAAGWNRQLYEAAAAAVLDERIPEAVPLLAVLAATPGSRAEALLGLAVCAARMGCYDEALVLAGGSRALGHDHPRVGCVAGLCEIERGNLRAAQAHLAAAARLARRAPRYHDDLRVAQRALLLMHLA